MFPFLQLHLLPRPTGSVPLGKREDHTHFSGMITPVPSGTRLLNASAPQRVRGLGGPCPLPLSQLQTVSREAPIPPGMESAPAW